MASQVEELHAGTEVHGGTAHESAPFPPFDSTHFGSQIIWLALVFSAIYLLMAKVALPRVGGILEMRKSRLASDLALAEKAQKDAEETAAANEKSLASAKAKAEAASVETHERIAAEAEARRKSLEVELEAKLLAAEKQIADMKTSAMAHVDAIASDAAQQMIEKITGQKADPASVSAAVVALKA